MTSLKELRDLNKGHMRGICGICGEPPEAQIIFQLRERGAGGKIITSLSRVVCESCAVRIHDLIREEIKPGKNR